MTRDSTTTQPVLTTRQLNRALLARQCLLAPVDAPLPQVVERVAGVPAQHGAAYVGLAARVAGFERDSLTQALENRTLIQATLMRQAIHVVSQIDFVMMAAGGRRARREWWLRVSKSRGLDEADYQSLADKLSVVLDDGPRTRTELLAEVENAGYPKHAFEGVMHWIDLVRVPPQGTWDHLQADLYGLADAWTFPTTARIDAIGEANGLDLMLERYLRAFGPASLSDVASWAGIPSKAFTHALERLDVRCFRDEQGGPLYDLPDAELPDPDTPAPVRFLPTWDATLLVHAKRAAIVPEGYRDRLFSTSNPVAVGSFLVDGSVAGTWSYDRTDGGRVTTQPFHDLEPSVSDEVDAEAERLAQFHA